MKELVAASPGVLAFKEYEDRAITDNEIYVKVLYTSPKHGSEIADFRGQSPFINEKYDNEWKLFLPRDEKDNAGVEFGKWNVGNMIVGEIIKKGKAVNDLEEGDTICSYGGIRETHIINAINNHRLHKLSQNVSWQNALCYDPAQFALGGIRDGNVRPGDFVAVFGLGAIGQIAVQIAKHIGAKIVAAIDPIEMRRNIALKNGADFVIDPTKEDVGLALKKASDKIGMDVIIETSGSKDALQHCFRGIAYGGTISYVAWPKEFSAGLNFGKEAHYNYANIIFSRVASEPLPDHPRWNRKRIEATVWYFISNNYINCVDIINPVLPFEKADEAYYHYVDQHPEESIKLGISF